MTEEEYLKHKPFAGDTVPSMLRRRVGHDYKGRCIYLVTMTIDGRHPLLGHLMGNADAPDGSSDAPRVELTELGQRVRDCWLATEHHYPEMRVLATMVMPDHLHGILFIGQEGKHSLGQAVKGFKAGCNREYRRLFPEEAAERALRCRAGTGCQQRQQAATTTAAAPAPAAAAPAAAVPAAAPAAPAAAVPFAATEWQPTNQQPTNQQPSNQQPSQKEAFARERRWLFPQREGQQQPPRLQQPGLLWSPGYNDHILEGEGELQRWFDYLQDNPRRLAVRRAHPEYFRVAFNVEVAGRSYSAIGNRELLAHPWKVQVQCSRSLTEEQVTAEKERFLLLARKGAVLVSPAISKGEQTVMRAVLDEHLPLVFLTPWGFNSFSKPGHQYYEACADGRFLILAPWPHQNQRIDLTRTICLQLNAMAQEVCRQ